MSIANQKSEYLIAKVSSVVALTLALGLLVSFSTTEKSEASDVVSAENFIEKRFTIKGNLTKQTVLIENCNITLIKEDDVDGYSISKTLIPINKIDINKTNYNTLSGHGAISINIFGNGYYFKFKNTHNKNDFVCTALSDIPNDANPRTSFKYTDQSCISEGTTNSKIFDLKPTIK